MKIPTPFSLDGETALVTGGGSGIGKAIAECFLAAGAQVIVVGRTKSRLQSACSAWGDAARYIVHDVDACDDAPRLADRAAEIAGRPLSILVNNAGNHVKKPALDTSDDDLQRLFQTHVLGAIALTRAVGAGMLDRQRGSILFVSSMAALFGIPNVLAYSAAKSALRGVIRSLAVEWSPRHVRVNAVAPGWIDTDMSRRSLENDPERKNRVLSRTPQHRIGAPEEIGWAAVYLCSPAAAFVTGQHLAVDGGASIGF